MPTSKIRSENVTPAVPSARTGRIRILRLAQVLDVTRLAKTKIYELQSEGGFPMRVQITAHWVGWIEEDVQAWLAKRVPSVRPCSAPFTTGFWNPLNGH
jgi:prophage regulatory protein